MFQIDGLHVEGRIGLDGNLALLPRHAHHFQPGERKRVGCLLPGERAGDPKLHQALPARGQVDGHERPVVAAGECPLEVAGRGDVVEVEVVGQEHLHAVHRPVLCNEVHLALQAPLDLGDLDHRFHLGRPSPRQRRGRQSDGERRGGKLVRLVGSDAQRTLLGSRVTRPRRRIGRLVRQIGPRYAGGALGLEIQEQTAADREPPVVQSGVGDGDQGHVELGKITLANGAAPPKVDSEALAVAGGLQERDLHRLKFALPADLPAADVVAFHPLDKVVGGHVDAEHLALAAAELQPQLPDEPETVFLHVDHGGASHREAAIDLAHGYLPPPLDAHSAAGAQGRFDQLVGLFRLVALPVDHLAEADVGVRLRHGDRERSGRRGRQNTFGYAPAAATLQAQAHGQPKPMSALARDVQ